LKLISTACPVDERGQMQVCDQFYRQVFTVGKVKQQMAGALS